MLKSLKKIHNSRGFTLLELLLVVALIAMVAGISAPVYQSFQNRNDLDVAANTLVHSLRRAQVLSQAADGDSVWGVHAESGSITVFRGADYDSRVTDFDEVSFISDNIEHSGISEITFTKLTGDAVVTGTFVLTSTQNEVRNITINEKGTITY